MMRKSDFHVHAEFSADSQIKLADLVPRAIQLGYTDLAVTEHLDLLPQEMTVYGIPSLLKYKTYVQQIQKQYPAIHLYCGIEVGDFQDVKPFADIILEQMQFDLVLGTVHFVKQHKNVAVPMRKQLSPSEILEYYERNLDLVETCNINVLAHLGVFKRYYDRMPDETHCHNLICRIFEVMISRGIALELNYSAFRRTYQSLHPETQYLELYRKLGGSLVTIGSDAHTLNTFNDYYQTACEAVQKYGFELLTP
jgi:histidinol-phosphatase (PHP family)